MPIFDIKGTRYSAVPYPALGIPEVNPVVTVVRTAKGIVNSFSEFNKEDYFPLSIDGWQLPDPPAIKVQGSKNIVTTKLNRGDRVENVLEEINLNNSHITIVGTLYSESDNDEYPYDLKSKLLSYLRKSGSREVSCALLENDGITRIAFYDWVFTFDEGRPTEQDYVIKGLSDISETLELATNE